MTQFGWTQMILWIIVILAAVVAIAAIARIATRPPEKHADSALQVLSERYARGDIDDDEYRRRREMLGD